MAYTKSECTCDYCNKDIGVARYDNGDIACKDCYETIESENATLKARIAELEAQI
jgi:hypothetical protein